MRSRTTRWMAWCVFASALSCNARGGAGGPGVGDKPVEVPRAASALVSAESGGSVSLGDEITLTIPPGSLAADTTIAIEKLGAPPAGYADGLEGFGQAYRLLPAGTRFAQELPAVMTLRYDGAALATGNLDPNRLQMVYFDEGMGRYVNVANRVDTTTNTITSRIEHFTIYMPVAQATIASGNPAPLVALQNSVPFPIRAGAPIYVRYTVQDKDPANAITGYTGGAVAGVKLYFRKLKPTAGPWQVVDMAKEPVVGPTFGGTIEDTYGYRIPETFLTAAGLGMGNDIEYCAQAVDNLGATNPPIAGTPACTPVGFDVTAIYQPGTLVLSAPTALPISAGFSRTFRVAGNDGTALFPIVPAGVSITNAIGTTTISPTNATITLLAQKQATGVMTVFMGPDSSSNAVTVTNGQVASIEILDTNGMPISGPLTIPGRTNYAFDVRGLDASGNVIHVSPSWSAAPSLGGIGAATGVLAAGNTATTASITATLGPLTASVSATVSPRYRVTANVTGLVGTTTLANNGGDPIAVAADGSYDFATLLPDLAGFNVAASVQPALGACHGGTGVITGADVTLNVQCYQLRAGSVVGVPTITGVASTLAGGVEVGYGNGTGALARFRTNGLNVTTDGRNIYAADFNNDVIRKIVIATGNVTTVAGDGSNCCVHSAPGSNDGFGIAAHFYGPNMITTDGTFLYVSDYFNATIRKIRIATAQVTTIAGQVGVHNHADGVGTAAVFGLPSGLVCDGPNLYVADVDTCVIRKIVLASGDVSTVAGLAGDCDFMDGVGTIARFSQPTGLSWDGTYLYVADGANHRVRRVDPVTRNVITVAGSSTSGHGDGIGASAAFRQTYDIATDGTNLYVSDLGGGESWIRKMDLATFTVTTLAGGSAGYTDGSAAHFGDNGLGLVNDGTRLVVGDTKNAAVRLLF